MFNLKDRLYYYLVNRNHGVENEYHNYVDTHPEEHANNRLKSWLLLMRLNWHYRVKGYTKPLMHIPNSKGNDRPLNKTSAKTQTTAAIKNKRKLPYLDGSESELSKRTAPIHFVKNLLQYDVISFDIFDTLVLRPFAKPADLFMIVGKRLNKTEFFRIRTDAEKRAREKAIFEKGNHEVKIDDIYAIIEERTGIPKDRGIKAELEAEMNYCFANPYMKRVFRLLQEQGKTIIITSDMYLPHDKMERLLDKVGYKGYEKLYVSCDYNCSKRTGGLYQYVKRDYEGKCIVHIGDNMASDILAAQKEGIDARYYKSCHEIGNPYRADGMSELVGSVYSGIVNTHLHNGIRTYSPYYEYGFIYGGIYIFGFCNWIHKKVKQEGIDKVLFLSRDGDIYQKVFNILFEDVPNEYFLWSRIANSKYTLNKNREDFLRRCVYYRAFDAIKTPISSLLESLSLVDLEKLLSLYGLSKTDIVTRENVSIIERFLIDNWNNVCECLSGEKDSINKYIISKVGNAKRVAFVDVGWLGSGATGLKYIIEEELKLDCVVKCWQVAIRPPIDTDILADVMDERIECYSFSRMFNRNHYDIHQKTNKNLNNIFFEMFTQATYPSYRGLTVNGRICFDMPELENYRLTKEIQEGIIDFCNAYRIYFLRDRFIWNISGYDAYCPFRFITRDLKWIKKFFGKVVYARGIGSSSSYLGTINDLIKQAKL